METLVAIVVLGVVIVAQAIVHYRERRHVIDQRDSMESEVRQLLAAKNLPEFAASKSASESGECFYMTDEEQHTLEQERNRYI